MTSPRPSEEWLEPGVFEVVKDVFRIPLPLPNDALRAVNVYLLRGKSSLVCIDSGWSLPESRERLVRCLASLECGPEDIERFLVTHVHRDHYTQAIALRQEHHTKVSLGAGERPALEELGRPGFSGLARRADGLRRNGAGVLADRLLSERAVQPRPVASDWEMPDDWLTGGDAVQAADSTLDVIETPGHTRGHVVFHDAGQRLLYAGDHVLPRITPSIGFEVVPSPDPLGDFLGSLARVRQLPDAMLLPAHGPVVPSAHDRIDELVDHHGRRLDKSLQALNAGADTAYEVALQLRWTRRELSFDDLDIFNQSLAVSETAAHLVLLEAQGRARSSLEDGINRFAALS
ncbi:MAG: MBL fold metallo-hydrolase [Acidimicrobiales bacterium]|jgi:glyoxylase-like metal-dependent hydrolase (beta-lactamase superfamily II)